FLYLAEPMAVEYRRGNQLLHGMIQPQLCERTDRFNNTLRFGEMGVDQFIPPTVGGFTANSPAQAAGLQVGDRLIEIDGKPVGYFSHIPELIGDRAGQSLAVKFERDGKHLETTVVPAVDKTVDCTGKAHTIGRLRIRPVSIAEVRHLGLIGAMDAG